MESVIRLNKNRAGEHPPPTKKKKIAVDYHVSYQVHIALRKYLKKRKKQFKRIRLKSRFKFYTASAVMFQNTLQNNLVT